MKSKIFLLFFLLNGIFLKEAEYIYNIKEFKKRRKEEWMTLNKYY